MLVPEKPLIIPIFIPHSGCPHQCAFCNQSVITNVYQALPDPNEIGHIINRYLTYKGSRKRVEIAYFGGNFLGLESDVVLQLFNAAKPWLRKGDIHGIRFSTRPDTITQKTLQLIEEFPVTAVEIGVQSMNDEVLRASCRGHGSLETVNAFRLLRQLTVDIGVQVMAGLPGDNETSLLDSTRAIAALQPDFARIYPLMVLTGSIMEKWYAAGQYMPLSLNEAVGMVKGMVRIFQSSGIKVIRLGLQASEMMEDPSQVLAGPWHPAFGDLVFSDIFFDRAREKLEEDPDLILRSDTLILTVHPRSISRMRGQKNSNISKLEIEYPGRRFLVSGDERLSLDEIRIQGCDLTKAAKLGKAK